MVAGKVEDELRLLKHGWISQTPRTTLTGWKQHHSLPLKTSNKPTGPLCFCVHTEVGFGVTLQTEICQCRSARELPRGYDEGRPRSMQHSSTEWCEYTNWPETQRRHRKLTRSASTLDEEVGDAKLSCGLAEPAREEQREEQEQMCVLVLLLLAVVGGWRRAVRSKTHAWEHHTCPEYQVVTGWTFLIKCPNRKKLRSLWSERLRKTTQFACLSHISHSVGLIWLLKEAKPATGRKRLHCNVCLGYVCVYVCACVCVGYEQGGGGWCWTWNIMSLHNVQGFRGVSFTFLTTRCEGGIQNKTNSSSRLPRKNAQS